MTCFALRNSVEGARGAHTSMSLHPFFFCSQTCNDLTIMVMNAVETAIGSRAGNFHRNRPFNNILSCM